MGFISRPPSRFGVLLLAGLLLLLAAPLSAQQTYAQQTYPQQRNKPAQTLELLQPFAVFPALDLSKSLLSFESSYSLRAWPVSAFTRSADTSAPLAAFIPRERPASTIQRMEAAFQCNDTPFIDQVRLPLGTFWGGRIKLVGFESDVTTANFVLGLPGAGTLHSLSMFGSGHLAVWTPPSDQLVGMNMMFTLRDREIQAMDMSAARGLQHAVRAGRVVLQSLFAR